MNISKTTELSNRYNWLAERNGIAVCMVSERLEFTLNSHAMLIFGVNASQINFTNIQKIVDRPKELENYLKKISSITSEFNLLINNKNTQKRYMVSGIKNEDEKHTYLTLQPLNLDHNNAEYLCQYAIYTQDTFLIWDTENKLLYVNQNFESLFERDRNELKNNSRAFVDWFHKEDIARLENFNRKAEITNTEVRIIMPDKSIKWVWFVKKALYDGTGNIFRHLAVFTDITKRKEVEEQLILNRTSVEQNKNPIYWLDNNANIIYTNQAASDMLGYSFEELKAKKIFDISDEVSPQSWPLHWKMIKENKVSTKQANHIKKNGEKISVEIGANYLVFEEKEYLFAFVIDISERKDIEKRIQYLQDFEHLLFDLSKQFITIPYTRVDASINGAFKELCNFTGSDSAHIYRYNSELNSIELTHYYSETNQKINDTNLIKIPISTNTWHFNQLTSERVVHVPFISQLPENDTIKKHCENVNIGSLIDISLFYEEKVFGFFGITCKKEGRKWSPEEIQLLQVIGDMFMNALQRRDFMNELLKSEQNYQEIYNATNEAIIIHNAKTGKIEDVNNAMLEMFDISFEQALKCKISDLSADSEDYSQENALRLIQKANEEPQIKEWQSKKNNGEIFWTEVSLKKTKIHGEDKIIAIIRDISERRIAQKLLKENAAKYKMIVEGQSELIVKLNKSFELLFISPSFEKVFKANKENILRQNFLNFVCNEDQEAVRLSLEQLRHHHRSESFEFNAQTPAGKRWLSWNFTRVKNKDENITNLIGVGRDITYQKMVEGALRESEERFRSIVQNLSDVVFLIDEKGNIKYVTPSCEQYLGLGVDELLGNNVLNIIHSDDQWLAEENIALHLEGSDYSMPHELRLKHKSNVWKVFEAKSQNLLDHAAVNSIIFTISDITERKLMEKQVLDAIIKTEEKERERFAKDLHDDLGPLLSSIKMYVGMLNKADKKEKRDFIVNNLQEIVKEAITTTKDVSNDLNPHVLNNYGLISALKLFIDKLKEELNIEFIDEIGDARYSTAIELSLYRITKELINNTIKHANATKIKVKIVESGNSLNLYFEDNGKGLPERAFKVKKPGGMGLSNIISRAKSLNARHTFHTNLKSGFIFEMLVPLVQE